MNHTMLILTQWYCILFNPTGITFSGFSSIIGTRRISITEDVEHGNFSNNKDYKCILLHLWKVNPWGLVNPGFN